MQKNDIKAVFFDIDGTLVSFKTHQVPPSTEKAIALLKSKGIKVIVSTGRSINSLDHIKHLDFDGYITFNGGYCVTKENGVLLRKPMDQRDIKAVVEYAQENELSFSFMSENEITIHRVTPKIEKMYERVNLPVPNIFDSNNFDHACVLQTNIFIDPEEEEAFMKQVMPNSIASRWSDLFADVNPIGQSKKVGIEAFIKHFGISENQTMAFGDGGNDIEMLKFVEVGVAMGNANPNVKEIADHITDDVDHNGVYNALKHFNVIG